jgi:hypothetical protein
MLGIEDPVVVMAYVLCLASTLLCVTYGVINWNKGDDSVRPEDVKWSAEEKDTENGS